MSASTIAFDVAAFAFGLMLGWILYRTLRRSLKASIGDIGTIVTAIAGGGIVKLFEGDALAFYLLGVPVGFFGYLIAALALDRDGAREWMGSRLRKGGRPRR